MIPELRRNLWVELTRTRLIAIPLILGLLFMAVQASAGTGQLPNTALAAGWVLLVLWGTRQAAGAVPAEMVARTWDGQRLSAQRPAGLMLGKLLGATAAPWYGVLWCLIAIAYAGPSELRLIPRLVATGLLAQAVAFVIGLLQMRLAGGVQRFQVTLAQIVAIVASVQLVGTVEGVGSLTTISWWGFAFEGGSFIFLTSLLFLAWAWIGGWRVMRAELQYRSLPLALAGFLVFLWWYLAGFTAELLRGTDFAVAEFGFGRDAVIFHVLVLATWIAAFLEPKAIVRYRRLLERAAGGRWLLAFGDLPSWVVGLPVVVLAGILVATGAPSLSLPGDIGGVAGQLGGRVGTHVVSILLFLLRDILLVHAVTLGGGRHVSALIYLVVLYVVVPVLLAATGSATAMAIFLPLAVYEPLWSVVGPAAQAAVLAVILARRLAAGPARGQPAAAGR